ncbi:Fur family transcriptional regulator [Cerasicoccus arenae]|uniref:Transcriptional repressor n=1 Tax=Cerasicoccus arenae TaxID=424488 RepID=A0A8J3DFL2_9BACT|nr:transcriptional repressor [Cerasicoccus arenae]MBK1858196.1 transcriptional repressor [Cerasicoccus arenae]GHC00908.1 transcriptional repressor [Cerasicoccus arenae]
MGKIFRETKQRAAILATLRIAEHPLTPKEIREQAADHAPGLGIATVYRNIRLLLDSQEIEALEVPGHRTCYLLPRSNQRAVVICRKTNRVRLAEGMDIKIDHDSLPEGFQPEEIEIYIYGQFVDED